jgi:hypothetical protein
MYPSDLDFLGLDISELVGSLVFTFNSGFPFLLSLCISFLCVFEDVPEQITTRCFLLLHSDVLKTNR